MTGQQQVLPTQPKQTIADEPGNQADAQPGARLVVFARLPVPGKCKTRLAVSIGADAAAECYRICAQHAFKQAYRCPAVTAEVHCSDASEVEAMKQWLADNDTPMPVKVQVASSGLGIRMHHALATAGATIPMFADNASAKVLIMGTDIPSLSAAGLTAASTALDAADLVVGPAADGGYYLLGVRVKYLTPRLFEDMTWSTPEVFDTTVQRAKELGLAVAPSATLPVLEDIDTRDDLAAWVAGVQAAQADTADGRKRDSVHARHPLYAYAVACLQLSDSAA